MLAQSVERAIVISVASVADRWCLVPLYSKQLFPTLLKPVFQRDTEKEAIFAKSGVNWTALDAAVLTNRQARETVLASNTLKIERLPVVILRRIWCPK